MREVVAGLQGSRIREVANEGIGREGVRLRITRKP
jgi:hypothetical protein